MRPTQVVPFLLVSCTLTVGCTVVPREAQLAPTAAPRGGDGYIAGTFTRAEGGDYAFVVRGDDGEDRTIGFDAAGRSEGRTGIVAVPPGSYRVTGWRHTLAAAGGTAPEKNPVPAQDPITRPFTVSPGHVVFLGSFDCSSQVTRDFMGRRRREWTVRPSAIPADEVVRVVRKAYPGFAALPVECLLCTPAVQPGAAAARPATMPALPPGTRAVLHYHRPDGEYAGWGLWAWESDQPWSRLKDTDRERPPGRTRTLPAFSAAHPGRPAGVDAFGAYWEIDAQEFGNGRVNFVLLKPGDTAEVTDHRSWVLFDSTEAWVNAGDGFLYLSSQDAERWWSNGP